MTFYDDRPDNFLVPLRTSRGDLASLEHTDPVT
jgi:hypothetical protein